MKSKNDNRQISKPKNIFKEFNGFEIEEKFQLLKIPRVSFLNKAKKVILKDPRFASIPRLEKFEWIFHFDYYGYDKNREINQAFVIVHHPSTPRFWVRRKESLEIFPIGEKIFQAWMVKRREIEEVKEWRLTEEERGLIIKNEGDRIGARPFLLGRLTREKYYTLFENVQTKRAYSLSLDFCSALGQRMSQLEIEYKWRNKNFILDCENINSILEEFGLITTLLLTSSLHSSLIPTKLTKYEWLLKLVNEGKKRITKHY